MAPPGPWLSWARSISPIQARAAGQDRVSKRHPDSVTVTLPEPPQGVTRGRGMCPPEPDQRLRVSLEAGPPEGRTEPLLLYFLVAPGRAVTVLR